MTEREVKVTRRYSPAPGRTVIVAEVPAAEATMGEETRLLFDPNVTERTRVLVHRALAASDAAELRITFSVADAAVHG